MGLHWPDVPQEGAIAPAEPLAKTCKQPRLRTERKARPTNHRAAKRALMSVDVRLVRECTGMPDSMDLCLRLGGFRSAKEMHLSLGMDAVAWSKLRSGLAHLSRVMDLCANEAPLLFLLEERGYDVSSLRRKESETETKLRVAQGELERMKAERAAELKLINDLIASGAIGKRLLA